MNFPQFWVKATEEGYSCWRWSLVSLEEAETLAQEALRQLRDRYRNRLLPPASRYAYADRPLREPVLREYHNEAGALVAVLTRNSYGCLVLNTARVMFIDVDLPEPKPAGGWWRRNFSATAKAEAARAAEAAVLEKARQWLAQRPDWGWRIYRTRAGLRLLATHDLFDPGTVCAMPVFDLLGADPLYRKLCKLQQCFRARLTPKPWRCDVPMPPARWPWPDDKAEKRFHKWEDRYLAGAARFATCQRVNDLGNPAIHPDVAMVITIHDSVARADADLDLA